MRLNFRNIVSIKALLIFTILGLLLGLEFPNRFGCGFASIHHYPSSIFYLTIFSLGILLYTSFNLQSSFAKKLFLAELLFYIFRLINFKSGYEYFYLGVPDLFVLAYDLIAISFRLVLLKHLFKVEIKTLQILLLTVGIILIKSLSFSIPPYQVYHDNKETIENMELQSELKGKYVGASVFEINDIRHSDQVIVKISTDSMFILSQNLDLHGAYEFEMQSYPYGSIKKDGKSHFFYLESYQEENLAFRLDADDFNNYNFELRRKL